MNWLGIQCILKRLSIVFVPECIILNYSLGKGKMHLGLRFCVGYIFNQPSRYFAVIRRVQSEMYYYFS